MNQEGDGYNLDNIFHEKDHNTLSCGLFYHNLFSLWLHQFYSVSVVWSKDGRSEMSNRNTQFISIHFHNYNLKLMSIITSMYPLFSFLFLSIEKLLLINKKDEQSSLLLMTFQCVVEKLYLAFKKSNYIVTRIEELFREKETCLKYEFASLGAFIVSFLID